MGVDKVTNYTISKCIGAAPHLVGHFAQGPMAVGELKKRQASMFPDSQPKKLIQHYKTRWNKASDMFERLVELRWPVCAMLSDRTVVKPADAKTLELKDDHWQLMSDLLPVLKPLQIATSFLSAERNRQRRRFIQCCGGQWTTVWPSTLMIRRQCLPSKMPYLSPSSSVSA